MKLLFALVCVVLLVGGVQARAPAEWKSRSIYFLLTDRFAPSINTTDGCSNLRSYCGGTWMGIQNNLDYIQGMGFNAIWITPVVSNTDDGYHGYWAKDLYSLNSKYGSETDLFNLIAECRRRDIWLMLDVVANHVGYPTYGGDYSGFPQFNSGSHYHSQCEITNWDDPFQVENCWLAGLPDLKQEDLYVKDQLLRWINYMITRYGFDGLRLDTVRHVPKWFWAEFQQAANDAGASIGQKATFCLGEAYDGRTDIVGDYQNYIDSLLSFPMYYTIKDVFGSQQSMVAIGNRFREHFRQFKSPSLLGTFTDNHDVQRFRCTQKDHSLLKNAIAMTLTFEGIPVVYYGTEQYFSGCNDPENREVMWNSFNSNSDLYQMIKLINAMRSSLGANFFEAFQVELYKTSNVYVYARTRKGFLGSCSFSESNREDCGFIGIEQNECESRGCCWKESQTPNVPWCFFGDYSSYYDPIAIVALTNGGSGFSVTVNVPSGGNEGKVLVNVLNANERITINGDTFPITLTNGEPKVFRVEGA